MTGRRREGRPTGRHLAVLVALVALTAGCSGHFGRPDAARTTRVGAATAAPAPHGADFAATLRVARAFTTAANEGDLAGLAATYAPDARFDRAGTLFEGRDEIVDDFMATDVVGDGGHYRELSVRPDGDRTEVEYLFTSRSGVTEHFTYSYHVEGGLIRDVVGRYV